MKRKLKIGILPVVLFILFLSGYLLGRNQTNRCDTSTFYATVTANDVTSLRISGLAVNDINYRGEFDLILDSTTVITWRSEPILASDLREGSTISVTFSGTILETYPARVSKVLKICLLDD